jgi:hypothetical protein
MSKKINKEEPKRKDTKETIQSIKRPLKDYKNLFSDQVKFRFLKRRFKLKDDDLITRKEFEDKKEEMYGKGG